MCWFPGYGIQLQSFLKDITLEGNWIHMELQLPQNKKK
jgi:hypothetical protein